MTNILSQLTTEQPHENTQNIDQLSSEQIMILINNEDSLITDAIRELIPLIARVADLVVEAFQKGGRLFYRCRNQRPNRDSGRLRVSAYLRNRPFHGAGIDRRWFQSREGSYRRCRG